MYERRQHYTHIDTHTHTHTFKDIYLGSKRDKDRHRGKERNISRVGEIFSI